MMRKVILILVGLLVFACYPAPEFNLDESFGLKYRETKSNVDENIKIRFERVISDERCPIEYNCFWAGNAEVELTFWKGTQKETFALNTGKGPKAYVVMGYIVTLMGLTPPNSVNDPPAQKKYVATVMVSKAGRACNDTSDCVAVSTGKSTFCGKKDGQCNAIGQCEAKPDVRPQVVDPVCGCDGKTYPNSCIAATNGVNAAYKGECGQAPRDNSCDDGTTPLCAMVTPMCADYEILAYQNSCYRCVNPATCLPWGQANCKVDQDCASGEYCDPCGSSSCPFCNDCVAACGPK